MDHTEFFQDVVQRAIAEIKDAGLSVYTFALYHDHESRAVSVCVDNSQNSRKSVRSMNEYNMKYFAQHLCERDYDSLTLWQANVGRSLSLGDFALINAARTDVPVGVSKNKDFYLSMVQVLVSFQGAILNLAENKNDLLFCCSGPEEEVALAWSPVPSA